MLRHVFLLLLLSAPAHAETVDVKYRGPVDLKPFVCRDTVSSLVNRVCSDEKNPAFSVPSDHVVGFPAKATLRRRHFHDVWEIPFDRFG
jgi:hypothetical protein